MAKQRPYRFVLYLAVRLGAFLFYLMPRAWALPVAFQLGRMIAPLIDRQWAMALQHLALAYGDEKSEAEIHELAKNVFGHASEAAVDVIQMPKWRRRRLEDFIDAGEAFAVYRALLAEGRGLISITAHMGNWELLAGVFCLSGFEGAVVARRVYYEPYNRWILGLRRSVRVRTIYREDAAKGILEALAANQIVGMLPDQDIESQAGVFVPFFGRPAYTPVAPVRIALATGAPLLPNFLIRKPGGRYHVLLGEVIRPVVETTREEAFKKYTEAWMSQFEATIRRWPDQWMWMHDRWETKAEPSRSRPREAVVSR